MFRFKYNIFNKMKCVDFITSDRQLRDLVIKKRLKLCILSTKRLKLRKIKFISISKI